LVYLSGQIIEKHDNFHIRHLAVGLRRTRPFAGVAACACSTARAAGFSRRKGRGY
jgi:hypothetical protein